MNLGQLESQLEVLVSEFPHSTYKTQIIQWFNLAQDEIARKKLIEGEKSLTSTASTQEYVFDGLIDIKRNGLSYNNKSLILVKRPDLDGMYDEWQSLAAGLPKYYLFEAGEVILVPKPDTTGLTIKASGYYYPDVLSVSADEPFEVDGTRVKDTKDFEPLLLEYTIGMSKYSLGFYGNTQAALSNFYSMLAVKEREIKKKEGYERQEKGQDPFLLRRKQMRLNNA